MHAFHAHTCTTSALRTTLWALVALSVLAGCKEESTSDGGETTSGGEAGETAGGGGAGSDSGGSGSMGTIGGTTTVGTTTGSTTTGSTTTSGSGSSSSGGGGSSGGDSGGASTSGGGTGNSNAIQRDEVRVYFFGHSLVAFNQPNTTVGLAMCGLAAIDGLDCCGNGRWPESFDPSNFAHFPEPINAQTQGPPCFQEDFEDGGINAVVMTEVNFFWKNPVDDSVEAGIDFVETMRSSYYPSGPIFLYEHWPELENGVTFETWKATDHEEFHRWFASLQDGINAGLDGTRVRLVPVGRVFTRLLREIPSMDELGVDDFFVDTDPHGTPTTYFIAGLVHYMVLYGQKPSTDAAAIGQLPGYLPAAVTGSYARIVDLAWEELGRVEDDSGNSRVW